jgi:hypothetical protein
MLERLVILKGVRRSWGELGQWTGLAPDDSSLLVRNTSSLKIYAFVFLSLECRDLVGLEVGVSDAPTRSYS